MNTYLVLLRGINVGGKNRIRMAELRLFLEEQGFEGVTTYIQSGNVVLRSGLDADKLSKKVEAGLPKRFELDSSIIKVLVLTSEDLQRVVDDRPKGFGDQPDKYHSDAIFLMGIDQVEAMSVFDPREGVDQVWPGEGVIYSQRLTSERTRSRLSKIVGTEPYLSMTIRSWNTTTKLVDLLENTDGDER